MFDIFKGRSDGGSLDGPQDHIGKAEDYGSNNDGGEDSSREVLYCVSSLYLSI